MTAIDDVFDSCAAYGARFPGDRPAAPAQRLAVVTCMDARLDAASAFGFGVGDAHVIRNAGGLVTDDVLRSLAISQRALGTVEVLVVQHTGCGMSGFDDAAFRSELAAGGGGAPPWDVPGFDDVEDSVRRAVATLRGCEWLVRRDEIRGAIFDVRSGALTEVR